MAKIVAVNISEKRGTIKTPIEEGKLIVDFGIEGDAHAGHWHRQVSVLAQESIDKMIAMGIEDLDPGKFAENITTKDIELHTIPVGTKIKFGECLTEVTQIGKECHRHCQIYHKIGTCIMPQEGIFIRVLEGGSIKAGDEVQVLEEE
jgi:MOSC domain-containing protein YiiM